MLYRPWTDLDLERRFARHILGRLQEPLRLKHSQADKKRAHLWERGLGTSHRQGLSLCLICR